MKESAARRRHVRVAAGRALLAFAALLPALAVGAEFRTTTEAATVVFDAPSAKAKPLYLFSRDTPLEVIVPLEGWIKVRDVGGTIGWVERKSVGERRTLVVRAPLAEVRANPDDAAPLVFRAEQNVILEFAESASSSGSTAVPGWIKVRHRDGQVGFVRIAQVFGI